jgi:protein-disulfide isomerase
MRRSLALNPLFTDVFLMAKLIRTSLILGAAALIAACGDAGPATSSNASGASATTAERTVYERPDDHAIGRVDAPLTIVEYASVTCPGCAYWHQTVYPELKERYVDTGQVRFVFREFLTGQPELAEAGFKIALCAAPEDYFSNIKLQFDRFGQIMQMAQAGNARAAYINLAKASGLSEEEFAECMANEAHRETIMSKMQQGFDEGVSGTPSFFINGQQTDIGSVEEMNRVLSELLGKPVDASVENSAPASDDLTQDTGETATSEDSISDDAPSEELPE